MFRPQCSHCWEPRVWSLVGELRSCKLCSTAKKQTNKTKKRKKHQRFLSPHTHADKRPWESTAGRQPSAAKERGLNRNSLEGTLILHFQSQDLWENKFMLFRPSSFWSSVTRQPKLTKSLLSFSPNRPYSLTTRLQLQGSKILHMYSQNNSSGIRVTAQTKLVPYPEQKQNNKQKLIESKWFIKLRTY